ncbi:FMN-binding protein [Cellulomonas hominis]
MKVTRWRGTLVFAGALVAMGATTFARFGGLPGATDRTTVGGESAGAVGAAAVAGAASGSTAAGTSAAGATAAGPATTSTADTSSATVTVAGDVVQTRYGPVQVALTLTAGTITDVQTLQSPSAQRESAQIAARSTPVLAQEVLAAQSAHIDTVSGATYTSEGYRQSVQSVLDQVG